jgi:hypothetical protein
MSIVRNSLNKKTQRFGNWICSRPQVRGGGTYSVRSLRTKSLTLTTGDVKQDDQQLKTRVLYTPDIRMSPWDLGVPCQSFSIQILFSSEYFHYKIFIHEKCLDNENDKCQKSLSRPRIIDARAHYCAAAR